MSRASRPRGEAGTSNQPSTRLSSIESAYPGYPSTANNVQVPAPRSSYSPLGWKTRPEPATRSFTVEVTSTSSARARPHADVCRELQVSEQTYCRWRNQFGGMNADDAKRLKDLERENATLKRLLADAELEKAALKEIAAGIF